MDQRILSVPVNCNRWEQLGFKITFFLFLLLSAGACSSGSTANDDAAKRPPNILLIMTDDQGWGDLRFHGNDSIYTPVLDSLARHSIRLNRFYVSPVCAPTRASLLTGRYHLRTGTSFVTARRETMRTGEVTIAEILRDNGYRTGLFGKWHNGEHYPNDPVGQGFDTFFGFKAGHWNNYFDTHLIDGQQEVTTTGFITDVLTDRARTFMRENRDQPFLCYVPYNAPHGPFQVPDRYFDKYKALGLTDKNAAIYGMVENVDDNIGRLLQTLDSLQLKENTIVVYLTDNGPNGDRYRGGMRGWKASVHEGGSRVPCFISWPGVLAENREIPELAAHIDLLPTLLDLAGIPLPEQLALDGKSLVPLLKGMEIGWPERSLYTAQMNWDPDQVLGAVRTSRYRMVVEGNGQSQLYDMLEDPGQQQDLATSLPEVTDSLRQQFDQWLADVRSGGLEPPPAPIGYAQAPRTFLPAPEAILKGQVRFKGTGWANDWITAWEKAGDQVFWPVSVETEGTYQLQLHYSDPDGSRPVLKVSVGDQSQSTTITDAFAAELLPSPDRVDRGEVYEKSWGRWPLPAMHLRPGTAELQVELQQIPAGNNFELKGVEVKKVEEQ